MNYYVLRFGVTNRLAYETADQERIFTNKRKAMRAVRELVKSLPAEWKEVTNTEYHLLAFEAEEVSIQDNTGEGYITLYPGQPPETHASWDDLPPFEFF